MGHNAARYNLGQREQALGLELVRVKKNELLTKLQANRADHRDSFEKALKGYQAQVIESLEHLLADARKGKRIAHHIALEVPQDQTRDYDRVISMLQMSLDEEIELTQQEFAMYVMDDWSWKQAFVSTASTYATSKYLGNG